MDDFDIGGPAAATPAAPPLSDISVAYALFTYFAFAFLLIGLIVQTVRLIIEIRRTPATQQSGSLFGRLFRAGADILLLRTSFFADRWAWIFGLLFHFGLLLVLLRHLRYFLDPAWVGPLWSVVELEQPFGFYGGMALPLGAACWWIRQIVLKQNRVISGWADHLVMALLIAIPLVGYANTIVHTDIVAVKTYATGLVLFDWKNIPTDPLLLTHLWLVAALMLVLPFSRLLLLLPFGNLLHFSSSVQPAARGGRSRILLRVLAPVLLAAVIAPAAVVIRHGMESGLRPAPVEFASLIAEHRTDDASVMISSHPKFLFSHRTAVLHQGAKVPTSNIERCVTCHVIKDAAGAPVGFDDPRHFCRGCHAKVAISIDCFECHSSRPTPEGQTMIDTRTRFADVPAHFLQRMATR